MNVAEYGMNVGCEVTQVSRAKTTPLGELLLAKIIRTRSTRSLAIQREAVFRPQYVAGTAYSPYPLQRRWRGAGK